MRFGPSLVAAVVCSFAPLVACQLLLDPSTAPSDKLADSGAAPLEAALEAAAEADAGADAASAESGCTEAYLLCETFEAFDAAAYTLASLNARAFVVTDGGYLSPSALRIVTSAVNDTSNNCFAYLARPLDGSHWRIAFDFRIETQGKGRYRIAQLTYTEGVPSTYALELWLNSPGVDGGPAIGDYDTATGEGYSEYRSSLPPFDHDWHHMELEFDQRNGRVTLRVDRSPPAISTTADRFPLTGVKPTLEFGAPAVFTPSTEWAVTLDNVTVERLQ